VDLATHAAPTMLWHRRVALLLTCTMAGMRFHHRRTAKPYLFLDVCGYTRMLSVKRPCVAQSFIQGGKQAVEHVLYWACKQHARQLWWLV
jgi:hypothetical protein